MVHMTWEFIDSIKEYFSDFNENFIFSIKLGNNSSLAIKVKGDVRRQVNGMVQIIIGVFYVPGLRTNLLSIG